MNKSRTSWSYHHEVFCFLTLFYWAILLKTTSGTTVIPNHPNEHILLPYGLALRNWVGWLNLTGHKNLCTRSFQWGKVHHAAANSLQPLLGFPVLDKVGMKSHTLNWPQRRLWWSVSTSQWTICTALRHINLTQIIRLHHWCSIGTSGYFS